MNKKELKIQKALGTVKTYVGFVSIFGGSKVSCKRLPRVEAISEEHAEELIKDKMKVDGITPEQYQINYVGVVEVLDEAEREKDSNCAGDLKGVPH